MEQIAIVTVTESDANEMIQLKERAPTPMKSSSIIGTKRYPEDKFEEPSEAADVVSITSDIIGSKRVKFNSFVE